MFYFNDKRALDHDLHFKAGTLIHESSHFTKNGGTLDTAVKPFTGKRNSN